MNVLFANNASSRLYQDTPSASTTIRVQDGHGAKFPSPTDPDFFFVTVEDRRSGQIEIMKCTARSGDILTVQRAQEGTVAQNFLLGATVSNRLTAATMAELFNTVGYTESEADAKFVDVAGDTMTGPLILPTAAPTDPSEAVTKAYADALPPGEAPLDGTAYVRQSGAWAPSTALTDTPEQVLAKLITVDGEGSGLDADLLDGLNSDHFGTAADVADLLDRMSTAESVNDAQDTRITTNETKNVAQDGRLDAIESLNTTQNNRLTAVETLNTTQDSRLTAVEAKDTAQDNRLTAVEGVNTAQDGRLTSIENINTGQTNAINQNSSDIAALQTGKANIASPTFTGDPKAPTPATADNDTSIATTAFVKAQAYLTDAPSDGFTYGRKNGAWSTIVGGAIVSDTAPTGALQNGQLWWESDTGNTFLYYVDPGGAPGQWVQQNVTDIAESKTATTRNRIVNPAFQIAQEQTSTSTSTGYFADQWYAGLGGGGTATFSQSITASYPRQTARVLIGTADTSIAATDSLYIGQKLEGQMIADLQWGTSQAIPAVLRFSALTINAPGTYFIALRDSVPSVSFVASFTLAAANQWYEIEIPIPACTGGTWPNDNSIGGYLTLALAMGSTYHSPSPNAWASGNFLAGAGISNGWGAAGNDFRIGQVGLYADPESTGRAPRFETPDIGDELRRCQRYYWRDDSGRLMYAYVQDFTRRQRQDTHPVPMRAAPTITGTISTGSNQAISSGTATVWTAFCDTVGVGTGCSVSNIKASARL
jgi:hypothetical protein